MPDENSGVMDVVYPVRPGVRNEELRFSLRSLQNIPHGTVWLAGFRPPWVQGVEHIRVRQGASKYRNSTGNIRAACAHRDVSDRFILMNDDFFILRPVDTIPTFHRGPVAAVLADYVARHGAGGNYVRGMTDTLRLLENLGFDEPLSYELHTPMIIDKARMGEALRVGADIPVLHKRTLYGNWCRIGGEEAADVKARSIHDRWDPDGLFLSTAPAAWKTGRVGAHVRGLFRDPSCYENDKAPRAVPVPAGVG